MAEQLIISISGMRGIIGENLTAAIAAEYGCAFGTFLRKRFGDSKRLSVCIGRDSRPSGSMLTSAVTAGLCATGVDVVDLGIAMTPTVGVMLRELGCAGGVVITASHNPIPYNGIKLLLDNGIAPPKSDAELIRQTYFDRAFSPVGSVDCGKVRWEDRSNDVHIEKTLRIAATEAISEKRYKVVLDSVNGAGGPAGKQLLAALGCEVIAVNDEPTGLFAHTPEPTEANLQGLCEVVKNEKADMGLAQDPDADRLAIVDENGRYIGEEFTLALAAKYVFSKQTGGKAAANLSTSRMIDDIAALAGASVIRTAVGEANVAGAMVENDCVIGGEGNGGIIDLRVGPVRDSLVGMALVLSLMAETGKTVGQLADEVGGYVMLKDKFRADSEQAGRILEAARQAFSEAQLDTTDGCRFDFPDGWIHLRTSNTEPVMRSIIEAKGPEAAETYASRVTEVRESIVG